MQHEGTSATLELAQPRRRVRHVYQDVTAERLRREAESGRNTQSGLPQGEAVQGSASASVSTAETLHPGSQPSESSDGASQWGSLQSRTLSQRLLELYGGGDRPDLRRMLFTRLEHLVNRYGEPAERLVREAAIKAAAANYPGNYFCRAVRLMLSEATFLEAPL